MSSYAVPESIRALKPKGTMIKKLHGKYYVYEYSCRKDDSGKWKTKMGKLIGSINEDVGFVPSNNKNVKEEISVLEYGQYALAFYNSKNTLSILLKFFNVIDAYTIYFISLIYFVNGFVPLKSINEYYQQSWLSLKVKDLRMKVTALSSLYDSLGRRQGKVIELENYLLNSSSKQIAIDGHAIKNVSELNDLSYKGNKYNKFNCQQLNVLMAYDINTHYPIMSQVFEGGIIDKISVKDLFIRHDFKDTLFIVDSGFYSNDNITLFSNNGNSYIIPLSSNLKGYKLLEKKHFDDVFVSETRHTRNAIEYVEDICEGNRVIRYKDVDRAALEKDDYYRKIDGTKRTIEKYEELKDNFGTITLQTNLDLSAKEIYALYKERWQIETFYNYFKNEVDFNALGLQSYYKIQGLAFLMLVTGLIRSEFKEAIKDIKGKTYTDILLEARMIKINKNFGIWKVMNTRAQLKELFKNLNVDLDDRTFLTN